VVLNFTSPKAAAQAIRKMDDIAWKPLHILVNVSANVSSTFRPAGVEKSVGIVSAAYYKDPNDKRWVDDAGYKEWLEWMKKYNASANIADPFNVVGYTVAQIAVDTLRRCGDNLTRENLLKQATTINELELPMLLPGIKVNTTPDDYRMIDQMQLQRFNGQGWELFGPVIKGNKG
jgi:branched-chain amino acid transport system substrate-binding protein